MKKIPLILFLAGAAFSNLKGLAASPVIPSTDTQSVWYYITSYAQGESSYCSGCVIYNTRSRMGTKLRWAGKSTDENALWKFVEAGDDTYYLINKATGYYMVARSASGESGSVFTTKSKSAATRFVLTKQKGQATYTIMPLNGNPLYAQSNGGFVVTYEDSSIGSPATWYFKKASTAEVQAAEEKTVSDHEDYQLIWSDEFNEGTRPSEQDWNFEKGFARNHEAQWYQSDNATISNGNLVIEARKERRDNPNYEAGSSDWKKSRQYIDYTSSSLTTSGKHSFTYGRVEVRAKIPACTGSWPAIWFLGYGGSGDYHWPHSGEIDLLEYYREQTMANFCWGANGGWDATWNARATSMNYWRDGNANWADSYHTWRMDWDSESIKLYLDNELVNAVNLDKTVNTYGNAAGKNPFRDNPAYLLVNLALGGDNGGSINDGLLPLQYKIDYVRFYQKPGQWHEAYGKWTATGIGQVASGKEDYQWFRVVNGNHWVVNAASFASQATVSIYDLSGKCLSSQEVKGANTPISAFDTLAKGVYTIRLTDGQHSLSAKVVK